MVKVLTLTWQFLHEMTKMLDTQYSTILQGMGSHERVKQDFSCSMAGKTIQEKEIIFVVYLVHFETPCILLVIDKPPKLIAVLVKIDLDSLSKKHVHILVISGS